MSKHDCTDADTDRDADDRRDHRPGWYARAAGEVARLRLARPDREFVLLRALALLQAAERDDLPGPEVRLTVTGVELRFDRGWRRLRVGVGARRLDLVKSEFGTDGVARTTPNFWLGKGWREPWREALDWLSPGQCCEGVRATVEGYFGETEGGHNA